MVCEAKMPTEKENGRLSARVGIRLTETIIIIIFSVFEEEDQSAFNFTVFVSAG